MAQWNIEDRAFVYHMNQLYEAKIIEIIHPSDTTQNEEQDASTQNDTLYRVHYVGWAKKWDETVPVDRMLPINDETRQLKEQILRETREKRKKQRASTSGKKGRGRGRKRRIKNTTPNSDMDSVGKQDESEFDDVSEDETQIKLSISYALRRVLVHDWENVTKRRCIVRLPKQNGDEASVFKSEDDEEEEDKEEKTEDNTEDNDDVEMRDVNKVDNLQSVDSSASSEAHVEEEDSPTQSNSTVSNAPSAARILNDYVLFKRRELTTNIDDRDVLERALNAHTEVIEGLKLYFDRAVGAFLLYRFERPQYERIIAQQQKQDKSTDTQSSTASTDTSSRQERSNDTTSKDMPQSLSEVYGGEHLLRLFVKLPQLLAHTRLSNVDVKHLQQILGDILKFLQQHQDIFFANEYVKADNEYLTEYAQMLDSVTVSIPPSIENQFQAKMGNDMTSSTTHTPNRTDAHTTTT